MIERYTLPAMGKIWAEENKFAKWLEVETAVCEVLSETGKIPPEAAAAVKERASFDIDRIKEIEKTTQHDVIAFLTNVAEYVGDESRFIHLGMTSSDLLDTALSCLLKESGGLILERVDALKTAVRTRALEHRKTPMVGRTHGIHAEPVTFGLKLAVWYEEICRREECLRRAVDIVSFGKISGAVGTYAHIDSRVEPLVMKKLGLKSAAASTQVLQRDRHAEFMAALALLAATMEKIATEIRNLQRTDILEVEEFFTEGQKGSSAMPHKRNPITCERICGLSRLIRSNLSAALDNVVLWHERDISHSSVERVILPDSAIAADYMLDRLTWVVEKLIVYPENMRKNLEKTGGLVFSQKLLLELTESGMRREEAYKVVQEAAMETWKTGRSFQEIIGGNNKIISQLGEKKLQSIFSMESLLSQTDAVIDRVFPGT